MDLTLEEMVVLNCSFNATKADIANNCVNLLSSPKFDFMTINKIIDELVQRNLITKEGTSHYYTNNNGKQVLKKNYELLQLLMLHIYSKLNS